MSDSGSYQANFDGRGLEIRVGKYHLAILVGVSEREQDTTNHREGADP